MKMKPKEKPQLKEAILKTLKEAETSWSGFVDVETLANRLHGLISSSMPFPKVADPVPEPPSEDFEEAFSAHHGTVSATCDLCGRLIFSPDLEINGDEGEWEECLKGMKEHPDRYVLVDYDSVSLGNIGGKQVVLGCPCNGLRKYEEFIWAERRGIAEYMQRKLKKAEEGLKEFREEVGAIKKAAEK